MRSEGGTAHMHMMPDRIFDAKPDADAYAVKMAKELIDTYGQALA